MRPSGLPTPLEVLLLEMYAKCIDGQEAERNNRITRGLGEE